MIMVVVLCVEIIHSGVLLVPILLYCKHRIFRYLTDNPNIFRLDLRFSQDRLCGLVVRVCVTDPEVPGSIHGPTTFFEN
jgi:hypothetical protein